MSNIWTVARSWLEIDPGRLPRSDSYFGGRQGTRRETAGAVGHSLEGGHQSHGILSRGQVFECEIPLIRFQLDVGGVDESAGWGRLDSTGRRVARAVNGANDPRRGGEKSPIVSVDDSRKRATLDCWANWPFLIIDQLKGKPARWLGLRSRAAIRRSCAPTTGWPAASRSRPR
jgi:hypothetical protein